MNKSLRLLCAIAFTGYALLSISQASDLYDEEYVPTRSSGYRSEGAGSDNEEEQPSTKKPKAVGTKSDLSKILRPEVHYTILSSFEYEGASLTYREILSFIRKKGVKISDNNLYDYLRRHKIFGWLSKKDKNDAYVITKTGFDSIQQLEKMLPDDDHDLLIATSSPERNSEPQVSAKKRVTREDEIEEIDDSSNKRDGKHGNPQAAKKTKLKLKIVPLAEPIIPTIQKSVPNVVSLEQLPSKLREHIVQDIKTSVLPDLKANQQLNEQLNTRAREIVEGFLMNLVTQKYGVSSNQMVANLVRDAIKISLSDQ